MNESDGWLEELGEKDARIAELEQENERLAKYSLANSPVVTAMAEEIETLERQLAEAREMLERLVRFRNTGRDIPGPDYERAREWLVANPEGTSE